MEFDNKLTLYFENEYDKKIAIDYINAKDKDDFIPAFSHFNLAKVDNEIIQRQSDPGLISQDPTPLCGIACVGNIIAKYFKLDFKYLIKDLFYYAEAFFGSNNYLIKPKNSITGQNYYINPKDITYPQGMPQADFILLTSIKNSENKVFSYDGLYQFGGVSFPYELVVLLTKMLNCKEVNDRTSITGIGLNEMELLTDMNKDYNDGCECLMLINSNMLHNTTDGEFPNHWVNYKGKLVVNDVNKQVSFKLFTWGQGDNKQYTIKQEVFVEHFYGYINAKIK